MEGGRDNQIYSPALLLLVCASTCRERNFNSMTKLIRIKERMPWRFMGERGAPAFLNKHKVYRRVSMVV